MSHFLGTTATCVFYSLSYVFLFLLKLKGVTQVLIVPGTYKMRCNDFLALYNGTYSSRSVVMVTPTSNISKQRCEN